MLNFQGAMDKGRELEAKVAELAKTKQELQRAKEDAIQSWLDSRPLIDELEMQKSNLADAKKRLDNSVIPELESQLEIMNKSIRSKREDHFKAETMSHEINHVLDQTRDELERLKLDIKKERQAREKVRQILQLRRLKLQTLQLTIQAALLESDALEKSADEALLQIKHSETHTVVVQLTHEEYYDLTRGAEERFSKSKQRVSNSIEKKLAAEAVQDLALSRLNRLQSRRSKSRDRKNIIGQWKTERYVEKKSEKVGVPAKRTGASPKALAILVAKSEVGKPQQSRRSRSNIKKKEKPSVFHQMKGCLEQKIRKLWG